MSTEPLSRPTLPNPPLAPFGLLAWARDMVRTLTHFLGRVANRLNSATPIIGTWNPGFTATTPGTPTYTHRDGRWTLVDDEVTFWGDVEVSAWSGSPAGNLRMFTLPFASANVDPETACIAIVHDGIALTAGYTQVIGNVESNSQNVRFYEIGSNQTAQYIDAGAVTPPLRIQVFGKYRRQFDESL